MGIETFLLTISSIIAFNTSYYPCLKAILTAVAAEETKQETMKTVALQGFTTQFSTSGAVAILSFTHS